MFLIKNSIKNLYRYKKRYFLFCILYLITICIAIITINIYSYMERIVDNLRKEYCSVVKIFDHNKEYISKNEYMEFENSNYVESVKFLSYNFCTSVIGRETYFEEKNIRLYTSKGIKTLNNLLYNPILVIGNNTSLEYLTDDELNIAEGRMFEKDNECVISKNSLKSTDNWNYLNVGDKVIFETSDGIYKEYTIVGVLKEDVYNDINTNARFIYTTFEGAEYFENLSVKKQNYYLMIGAENGHKKEIHMGYDALIYLKDYGDFDNFYQEVFRTSNGERRIEPLFSDYQRIRSFINNMQAWSVIFIILSAFIIILITIISTMILLNMRKYEIAVLRSNGMKKSRLIVSYLIENLVFICGITIISLIAAQFIEGVFKANIAAGIRDLMSAEMFEKLTQGVNLDLLMQNIGLVFSGTTVVVMLSLILAFINIIRFEPLKIFNKQY